MAGFGCPPRLVDFHCGHSVRTRYHDLGGILAPMPWRRPGLAAKPANASLLFFLPNSSQRSALMNYAITLTTSIQ